MSNRTLHESRLFAPSMLRAALLAVPLALSACGHRMDVAQSCAAPGSKWNCLTPATPTEPAPQADPAPAAYEQRMLAMLAADRKDRMEKANGIGVQGKTFLDVRSHAFQQDYRAVARQAAALEESPPVATSKPASHTFLRPWRISRQTLYLGPGSGSAAPRIFHFSGLQARRTEISLLPVGTKSVVLDGTCDGALQVLGNEVDLAVPAGRAMRIDVTSAARIVLQPAAKLNRCDLVASMNGLTVPLTLLREETVRPDLARLDSRVAICRLPALAGLPPLDRAFFEDRWLSQTCPIDIGTPRLLDGERKGFDAKVEALLGRPLPAAFYDRGDPTLPLDFAAAPKLDLIYLSYLDIKADFSGRVIERLVRHHAARGTPVRIVITGILEREKDKALLRGLAVDFPNVQLQEFAWTPPRGAEATEQLSRFFKTHHVKMLAALSDQPGRSRVILGGRNIHDGFLFDAPLDLSRFPELQQYGPRKGLSLNYYANYDDFDLEIRKPQAVRTLAAHLATLWHRDGATSMVRPFSIATRAGKTSRQGNMRHFISVPYADGNALERFYVELIDTAQKKIEIANPYLNPTPEIIAALERALARSVKVTMVVRVDLRGDIGGKLLTALNEMFVGRFADRIAIYEYSAPKLLLHAKMLMVDGRLVTISSVNLNHRSFIHDTENGIVVLDRAFYRRISAVFERFRSKARRLDADVSVPLRYRMLFSSDVVRGAF